MANETLSASTPARKHDRPLFLNTWFWVFVVCISAAVTASLDGITVQPAVAGALSYAAPQAEAALLSAEQNSTPALSLLDDAVSAEQKSGALTLTGTIQNHSTRDYSYAQVNFNLYDANGNQIGTASDCTNNLKPSTNWNFNATAFDSQSRAASYELADIICW